MNRSFWFQRNDLRNQTETGETESCPLSHSPELTEQESYDKVKWESQSSMLMPGAAEKFVETAVELLKG